MRYSFYSTCVGWQRNDVYSEGGLNDMIADAIEITRRTFLKHVDQDELDEMAANMAYSKYWQHGLTMASDWHICYKRSKLHGKRVYFFVHSAIEHVFVPQDFE